MPKQKKNRQHKDKRQMHVEHSASLTATCIQQLTESVVDCKLARWLGMQ